MRIWGWNLSSSPFAPADLTGLARVTASVATPIMADESCFCLRTRCDWRAVDVVDALNIKLMKCGRLRPALSIVGIAGSSRDEVLGRLHDGGHGFIDAAACLAEGDRASRRSILTLPLLVDGHGGVGSSDFGRGNAFALIMPLDWVVSSFRPRQPRVKAVRRGRVPTRTLAALSRPQCHGGPRGIRGGPRGPVGLLE